MGPRLSVVVPVHNEADFLPTALPRLVAELRAFDHELLVVENGSTDDTATVAERLLAELDEPGKVLSLATPDYGAALREGMRIASGDRIVMFDIDYFSGAFVEAALAADADIVIASKRAEGSDDRRSLLRRTGTWGFNRLLRTLFSSSVGDTHGMKVFARGVVDAQIDRVRHTTDLFDTELVLRAERAGATIAELPVVVEEQRDARSSFVKRVPRTLRGLREIRSDFAAEGIL
jgi:glycosyltransferase involved in cell wall biosynthesis